MDKSYMSSIISEEFLNHNPDYIFVFGDNTIRKGTGGAAKLRYHKQSYGFITKKFPSWDDNAYYKPNEYKPIYERELEKLKKVITENPDKTYLISKLGAGLANRYMIFEKIIEPNIKKDSYGRTK